MREQDFREFLEHIASFREEKYGDELKLYFLQHGLIEHSVSLFRTLESFEKQFLRDYVIDEGL